MADEARAAPEPPAHIPLPGEWSRRVRLRDGRDVLLRQIRASDRSRLAEGLRLLSPASRYLRFHTPVERLTERQLDQLCHVDHRDHEAIVALDLSDLSIPGVGVARYLREPSEPNVAETAITVADDYHGQGAATLLLGALAARAREHGIEVFRNHVLSGNHAMLDVFDQLGATRTREDDGSWRVDLTVPALADDIPNSPAGRAYLQAGGIDRLFASTLPLCWPGRRRQRTASESPVPPTSATVDSDEELDRWLRTRDGR